MARTAHCALAATCLAIALPAWAQPPERPAVREKAPWGALTDSVAAGEIVLRDVCLTGIAERKPIEPLALYERLVSMPPRSANAGAADKVWRLASIVPVYAVAWADGSCSAYVDRGPSDRLRAMAERVIRARPEGFVLASSGLVDADRVERSVYCGKAGGDRVVATITTPNGKAGRGMRALSSTVYRASPTSTLCPPSSAP
jgi:hypothetical protein